MPLRTAGYQFPALLRQQVLDELEVSGRVSFHPSARWREQYLGYTESCEISGRRADCASVFFSPPMLVYLQEDLPHEAIQGADPIVSLPSSELGLFERSFRDDALFPAILRLFNFWTRRPSVQFCWHFGFALLRALSLTRRNRIACVFRAVCLGNYTFFRWQGRLPPSATQAVRSSSSVTFVNLLRSTAIKLPATGTSQTQERMGTTSRPTTRQRASSQCWLQ